MKNLLLKLKTNCVFTIAIFFAHIVNGQTTSQVFNSSGSFTIPNGVYQITAEAWGAGGSGGATQNVQSTGGGGGGGAYAAKTFAVSPGQTYTVTVGNGSSSTAPGGSSSVRLANNATNLVLAVGGNSALTVATNIDGLGALGGDVKASGGNGANGDSTFSYGGGGGTAANYGETGFSATGQAGASGTCNLANGGNGSLQTNFNGSDGNQPGSGGGGSRRNNNNGIGNNRMGGTGGNGRVIISWDVIQPASLTKGPGGVTSDLQLWLRADLLDGTTTYPDNTNVNTWTTQARGANAVKANTAGAPIYRNNTNDNINYNPVVDFSNDFSTPSQNYSDSNASRQYLKGTSGYYTQETFVVLIPNVNITATTSPMEVFCGDRLPCQEIDHTGIVLGNVDTRFNNEIISSNIGTPNSYGAAQVNSSSQFNSAGIINSRNNPSGSGTELYLNNTNLSPTETNTTSFRNINDSQFWIGRSEGYDASFNGRIAEIITYNKRKNDVSERLKIASYLAIKYGITLGSNGTSQNYVDSNGTLIWNANSNTGYNYNIAGIGRDDASNLNQKQSKGSNPNATLTIGLGNIEPANTANTNIFSGDKEFLVWGDNGGNMNDSGSDVAITFGGATNITTLTDIPNKKWKIVETGGDITTVKISIPSSALANLPAISGNDAYVMLVASDASFSTNVETVFLTENGPNQEGYYDFDGTKYVTFGVAHETKASRSLTFNGTDNIMKVGNNNDLTGNFTMMTWVKPNGQNALSNDRTIISKYDGSTGYRIYLTHNNTIKISWTGASELTSATILPDNEWHNIALLYNGTTVKLYIDGVLDTSVATSGPSSTANIFSIGGEYRNKSDIRNYFKGDIDELKFWNKALTVAQIRFMLNQEILRNNTKSMGAIIPRSISKNDISTINWSNLTAYYTMNSFIGTHINDDSSYNNRGNAITLGKIAVNYQSAPMPYETTTDGLWSSNSCWKNGATQSIPNSNSIVDGSSVNWNIVKTNHNINSTGNKTLLGLMVSTNTLSATNDSKIQITHYLKLDGKIDLVGKSQLIQTSNSDLDPASSGALERDQEGSSNKYNYNYWSSPVSTINNTLINNGFTIADVMKDGTDVDNIQNIQWTSDINSSATSPITLSSYWIYKFQNLANNYANWGYVGPNGTLLAGQGYTLKGSNAATASQNYTFIGKPNNGTITTFVAPNSLNLSGNPYPSAIDADVFINDNIEAIDGTLYFWEHYATNTAHTTIQYQGGYATRTLVGGTPPVSPSTVSGIGTSPKTPGRYIPVGQGFFIKGSTVGGNVTFGNNQRIFIKEDNNSSYSLFKTNNNTVFNNEFNNSEDTTPTDTYTRLRIGYNSADNYHRQILMGFMNQNASEGYDKGYDAIAIETLNNDMYFISGTNKLNIQGVGYFNPNNTYPIGIKNNFSGNVKFVLDTAENFSQNQEIYIYDNTTNLYHNIKNQAFEINLPAGIFENRFSLRFNDGTALGVAENETENQLIATHSQANDMINILNELQNVTIEAVALFNMIGQNVTTLKIENQNQREINLPVTGLSSGAYIVKVITDKGEVTKKILIK